MKLLESLHSIYFCAGARNHDILKVLPEHKIRYEFDERMASFKALGLLKSEIQFAAICTTSGTAVAECVPAMLEAFYSRLPLILITGDRPKKMHGTGAPQTIDHEILTRGCRADYLEVGLEDFLRIDLRDYKFPLHINVLIDDTVPHLEKTRFHQSLEAFEGFVSDKRNPLFIFSHEEKSMRTLIEEFAPLGLPFYAEALSGGRDLSRIKTEKGLIDLFNSDTFDCVIRIGHTPLSKVWRLLEKKLLPVFSFDSRSLSALSYGDILPISSKELLNESRWWEALSAFTPKDLHQNDLLKLHSLIKTYPESEIAWMKKVHDTIPEAARVYLGNSLVVRFFELVQSKRLQIQGSRGVNGIDGQLATAIGLSQGTTEIVYCILGDITTLYDLSSLRDLPQNLKLIIMNNHGGRIFDMLNLDKRVVMEHEIQFEEISRAFKLSYSQDLKDWEKAQVLEIFPHQDSTQHFLREWNA